MRLIPFIFILACLQCVSPQSAYAGETDRPIDKVFYENGDLFSETNLFSDRNNGFYYTYHHNGQLATMHIYKNNQEILDKAFDPNGRPILRNGTVDTHYANGVRECTANYRNDLKEGEMKCYDYDGVTVVDIWNYWKGHKVAKHLRFDESKKLLSIEDLGYPSEYVQRLKLIILALSCTLLFFVVAFILYKEPLN